MRETTGRGRGRKQRERQQTVRVCAYVWRVRRRPLKLTQRRFPPVPPANNVQRAELGPVAPEPSQVGGRGASNAGACRGAAAPRGAVV